MNCVQTMNQPPPALQSAYRSGPQSPTYTFASQPRALLTNRKKCVCPPLDDEGRPVYGNIMYDRRVVRGSTFSQNPMPTADGESQAARQAEARRRAIARRKAQGQQTRNARFRVGTPPPVAGRRHEVVQTERYLEELFDRPPEVDVSVQTDLFLDRPASPLYIPASIGVDVSTQIYPGDLFEFDVEVGPILEVLVGKTIEQALLEVLEEDELSALRAQQRRFQELHAADKAEEQRLEERERRLREEKERRVEQYDHATTLQKETEARIAAAVLTTGYIKDLLPSVLEGLEESGFMVEDIRTDVEDGFMPWLEREVQQEMDSRICSREMLSEMVRDVLERRAAAYANLDAEPQPEPETEPEQEVAVTLPETSVSLLDAKHGSTMFAFPQSKIVAMHDAVPSTIPDRDDTKPT